MKTKSKNVKLFSLLLSILVLFQSCVVYHAKIATVEEAIQSHGKVKIRSPFNEDVYKFKMLNTIEGQLYGLTKRNSSTAKKLFVQDSSKIKTSKYVKILITDDLAKVIHLHNKTMSTILSIGIPAVLLASLLFIASGSFIMGSGSFYWY